MILFYSEDQDICHQWRSALEQSHPVQEVRSKEDLLKQSANLKPDIILIHLTPASGIAPAQDVLESREKYPESRYIIFSDQPDDDEAVGLLRAGIHGYSKVDVSPELLGKAGESVASGEIWGGRKLMQQLVAELGKFARTDPSAVQAEVLALLTDREREIAMGVANAHLIRKIERDARCRAKFGQLLSPSGVGQVMNGKIPLENGGKLRAGTFVFAELRGFTT